MVIFPFANSKIYDEVEPKLWFDVNPDEFSGFSELLISKRQQITNYSEQFSDRFVEEQHKLELDAFNILYVALTRAVEALFIISDKDLDTKGLHKTNVYSGLFIHYLTEIGIWSIDQNRYSFGALKEQSRSEDSGPVQESIPYILSNKHRTAPRMVIKNATLWDDQRIMALERGTLIHYIMSQIRIKSDFDHIVARTRAEGLISEREAKAIFLMISKIINHPDLKSYYMEGRVVKNEQEIIGKNGLILRPDRLIIDNNDVTVIDYKTGMPKPEDRKQILEYGDALREMGYSVQKRIIVYIDQDIKVEFIQ